MKLSFFGGHGSPVGYPLANLLEANSSTAIDIDDVEQSVCTRVSIWAKKSSEKFLKS
jgi:hypothetical protein